MVRRPFLLGVLVGVLATLIGGYLFVKFMQPDDSEKSEAVGPDPHAEFPDFFVSDSSLISKTTHELVFKMAGKSGDQGVEVAYCAVFADGRWVCGTTDSAGNSNRIHTEQQDDFNVFCDEDAYAIWDHHVRGEAISPPKPTAARLPQPSGANSPIVYRCQSK